jgi:DNA (cytosine-5)-methyltransferase 1
MNVLSLFSGIGGLELGLERAGMTVVGQVEIDEFCQRVLAKHWPEVPRHDDVRTTAAWWRGIVRPSVDILAGGFPCQPFSAAGRRKGVADERWGWPWMADVVRALRPRYVLVENVTDLVRDSEAFGWMLGDLSSLGFDAEWSVVSACSMGAPHTRERVFVLAYPAGERFVIDRRVERGEEGQTERYLHHWAQEPEPHRVADGVPRRVDRNRALGNAVVPQVGEYVGRLILSAVGGEVAA